MNCSKTQPLLHAYADGELDLVNSLDVEQHILDCPDCAAVVRQCRRLQAALREADLGYRAPAGLRARVRAALPAPRRERPLRGIRLWQLLTAAASVAAALAIMVRSVIPSAHDRMMDEAISSHVRSLMAEHLTDVASSDQHTVKPWFAGRLDFTLPVKDFAAQGFVLVGGRLDYLGGRPAAALVYRHNQHVINVFIRPRDGESGGSWKKKRGYSIVERDVNDLHVCAVSDLNLEELKQLVAMLAD